MDREELRKQAMEIFDNKNDIQMLGCGISRDVYTLNDNLVIKIERYTEMSDYELLPKLGYKRIMKEIENNHITNRNYLNTISILNLGVNKESVKIWLGIEDRFMYHNQNIIEALNYRALKFSPLQKHLLKVVDIFVYKNFTILIQEKGVKPKNIHCKGMVKFKEFVDNIFRKKGYQISDIHYNNILCSTSNRNTYLICDTGTCQFYDRELY
ncbi:MAG: hypothetical protein KQ78_01826 [Candidatus Izimaplasma bacterium HR2]|nr:MAG: hypothetical protein KQ78_01826 [Candidatus Izimaplasma bacterium HR2]